MSNQPPAPNPVPISDPIEARLRAAAERYGESEVVARSIALLGGANAGEEFLLWVGGRHAQGVLEGAPPLYWPEVWGARALMYVWDAEADVLPAITAGLANGAWRVREMCAKVALARELPVAPALLPLLTDDVARVRAAAARALGTLGDYDQGVAVSALVGDPDLEVRRSAGGALRLLRSRLDRPVP